MSDAPSAGGRALRPFSLLVKPASADCNLRCRYCFYLDRCELYPGALRHRMSDEVLERMISSFMATGQAQYAIGWQGGEPTLMGVEFFRKVTALQERFGRPGDVVSNGLQTNGTLIDAPLAEHLARYRFLLGVSLDGPPRIHDRFRRTADGKSTHAAVMNGIDCLKGRGVDFNILTLVSRANVDSPAEVYRYLCGQGFLFHQYIECVEFGEDGALQPFAVAGPEWGEFMCAIYDAWIKRDTRRVSVRLFDSILARLVDGVANVCHMGTDCRQYLVVEHNGDVYPCDFHVREDLRLGNIMRHSWNEMLASEAYAAFGRRKRDWHGECGRCEFVRFCGGDCPKNRPAYGRDPQRLSTLCEGWKTFFAHAMPGLRRLADEIRAEREQSTLTARQPVPCPGPVGRNDPCPCGSGRKYKRCCGAG